MDCPDHDSTYAAIELIEFDLKAMISDEECRMKRQNLIMEYNIALDMLQEQRMCSSITTFTNVINALQEEIEIIIELGDNVGHAEEQIYELKNAIAFLQSIPHMSCMIDGELTNLSIN